MKKPGAIETHVRQVLKDYEWLMELAQERVNLYQRLVSGYRPEEQWEVRNIEEETIYAERFLHGEIDTLGLPLAYLWAPDLAATIEAEQAKAAAAQARASAEQAAAAAREKSTCDRLTWRRLVETYGEGGPLSHETGEPQHE